jgi:transposase
MKKRTSSSIPTLTIGLDVGDKYTYVCGIDADREVVIEERLPTREPALRRRFANLPPARIALEVGRHSLWLSRLLAECGHEVLVANPRKVRLITSTESKNDRLDAEKLARLARVDPALLYPVRHRREETQGALAIVRSREVVVAVRTKLINTVRAQILAAGGRLPSGHVWSFHELVDLVPEVVRDAVAPLMQLVGEVSERIRHYDRVLEDLAREVYPETELLRQVWGVGPVTALTYVLVLEDAERFSRSRDVGAYLGLRPRQDQSGDVDKQLRITKAGDSLLRKLLVQCAHRVLSDNGPDTDLKRWGLRLAERGGKAAKKRAVVAVARKLAVLLHRLWVTGEVYEPLRNAERATAAA